MAHSPTTALPVDARQVLFDKARKLVTRYPSMPASQRLQWARSKVEQNRLWSDLEFDDNGVARIERDGFTVHMQYGIDEYPDLSWFGRFADNWEPGAIKHLPGWSSDGRAPNSGVYGWFIPAGDVDDIRGYYRRAGFARHEAWRRAVQQVRTDYDRMASNDMALYLLTVTVYRDGVELASDIVGGVDLGFDLPGSDVHDHQVSTAVDLIGPTIAEAKVTLKRLAGSFVADATM